MTWQRLAEHPLSGRQLKVAARAATRTLEGHGRRPQRVRLISLSVGQPGT